jgi:hypothetical protein
VNDAAWTCPSCGAGNPRGKACFRCRRPKPVLAKPTEPIPDSRRPILRDPRQFLVLPMPRQTMGTVRMDGTRLRVRNCSSCGCHTTIPLCPVCGQLAEASRPPPEEDAPGVPQQEHSLTRGKRPRRGAHLQGAVDTMGLDEEDVLDVKAKDR